MTVRPTAPPAETRSTAPLRRHLLADGALRLEFAPALAHAVEHWLPLLPQTESPDQGGAAVVRVLDSPGPRPDAGREPPTLRLGGVGAWVRDEGGAVLLRGEEGGVAGWIDLAARAAALHCPAAVTRAALPGDEVYSALTLSSALLLGRLGRALVHAAAAVDPEGGAWLLVGDSHAGKTTTTVNLIGAGWGWVSDDHVVLGRDAATGGVVVEGWPRRFHLDAGWEAGTPGQPRGEVDPRRQWAAGWRRRAPLAGLLLPRVRAGEPTRLRGVAGSEVLAPLIRQSPWLLADRGAAPGVLALLREASAHPAFALSLGMDTYGGGPPLLAALRPLAHAGRPGE